MPLNWHMSTTDAGETVHSAISGRLYYHIVGIGPRRFHVAVFVSQCNGAMPPKRWPVEIATLAEAKAWCERYDDRCGAYANRGHRKVSAGERAAP